MIYRYNGLKGKAYHTGLKKLGIDKTSPIIGGGVLLDIAKFKGEQVLENNYTIIADDLKCVVCS